MRIKSFLLSAALALFATGAASASTNLVKNGDFSQTTNGSNGRLSYVPTTTAKMTTLTDWSSYNGNDGGWNFVLDANTATTWDSVMWLYGKNNGYTASANGGAFLASDPDYHPGTVSQSIGNLTVGGTYTLSFEYALIQQNNTPGANYDDYWHVVFGNSTQDTSKLSIAQGGFSGWQTATMTFTATSATQVLSFLAKNGSTGAPPFMLLDGVSLVSAVPEPSTWGMLLGGLGLVGFIARRRAKRLA